METQVEHSDNDECRHNASADSGQSSSSPDVNSQAGSLVDSLEDQEQPEEDKVSIIEKVAGEPEKKQSLEVDQAEVEPEANNEEPQLSSDPQETIKSLQDSALSKIAAKSMEEAEQVKPTALEEEKVTPESPAEDSGHKMDSAPTQVQPEANKAESFEQPDDSVQVKAESLEKEHSPPAVEQATGKKNPQISNLTTNNNNNTNVSNNNNNNNGYSGLNLNMTASEMRELLARRKKFDPKKAQMNIRQKYEIIQQM